MTARQTAQPATKRKQLAVIQDLDFSGVSKADAKLVWLWEISRQFLADGYEPEAKLAHIRKFLKLPYHKIPPRDFAEWYQELFGATKELPKALLPDGRIYVQNDLRPIFGNLAAEAKPFPPNLGFGFEVSPFVKPHMLRDYVSYWLDQFVIPQLVYPKKRRGPKSDHLAWLTDLAIYRADVAGIRWGRKYARLTRKLPEGRESNARFNKERLSKAKANTLKRLDELARKGFHYSVYGKLG